MPEVKWLKHLPWLVLFLLLAGGSTLWLLFVGEQQTHLRLAFETQLERLSDELLRSRLEGRLGPDALPAGIQTFAVYGPRGEQVAAWGDGAPRQIDQTTDNQVAGTRTWTTHQNGSIEFIKVLEPLRPRLNLWGENDSDDKGSAPPRGMMGRRGQGFLYLRISDSLLEGRMWAWTVGSGVGLVAWAGFLAFVGLLWFRTRRYQDQLVQHRELLQFAEASRTLSHELQNPLAAILLQTALLKRASGEDLPSEVAIIEEEAQRMSALVARVRDFLKDPKGQAERVDLVERLEALRGRFPVEVALSVEGLPPHVVLFDPHRFRSVLENLVKNAVESGPDPRPTVRLSKPKAGWIRIEVCDSGSGFTPESLKQALNPFYTTKTTGTGIGLSISDGFVRAAGGRLKLENRPEGGARVTLDLPEAPGEKP